MVQINMPMPSCCSKCPLFDDRWDYPTCYLTDEARGYNFPIREKRMPGCPLVEASKKVEYKLKPCPFCGTEPTIIVRCGKDGWRDRYAVLCDYEHGGCGAESGWYHYESEAVEAWNRRHK